MGEDMEYHQAAVILKPGLLTFLLAVVVLLLISGCSKKDKKNNYATVPASSTGSSSGTGSSGGSGGGTTSDSGINLQYSYKWTVGGDASAAQLEAIAANIQKLSDGLYRIGEGQQYIKSVNLIDRANDGRIHTAIAGVSSYYYEPGYIYAMQYPDGNGGYHTLVGGLVDPFTFAHEHGHNTWYLPGNYNDLGGREEYNYGGCACVMSTVPAGGRMQYCDASNHRITAFTDCWEAIKSKCSMKHTTGSYPDPGPCPTPTNVTISNR